MLKLDKLVISRLCADATIDSFSAIANGLLANSIDAGATIIEMTVDFSTLSISVADNGSGINSSDLKVLGKKDYTSKSQLSDRKFSYSTFGYKGNFLNALKKNSKVNVLSKASNEEHIYQAYLQEADNHIQRYKSESFCISSPVSNIDCLSLLKEHGCIIEAICAFSKVPVRRSYFLNKPFGTLLRDLREDLLQVLSDSSNLQFSLFSYDLSKERRIKVLSLKPSIEFGYSIRPKDLFASLYGSEILHLRSMASKILSNNSFIGIQKPPCHFLCFILVEKNLLALTAKEKSEISNTLAKLKKIAFMETGDMDLMEASPVIFLSFPSKSALTSLFSKNSGPFYEKNFISQLSALITNNFIELLKFFYNRVSLNGATSPQKKSRVSRKVMYPKPNGWEEETFEGYRKDNQFLTQRIKCIDTHGIQSNDQISTQKIESILENRLTERNFEIINQIDKKFILTRFFSNSSNVLIVIDQHACDERIRIELLFREYLSKLLCSDTSLGVSVPTPIEFLVNSDERILFLKYKLNLKELGIRFMNPEETVAVTHLPFIMSQTRYNPDYLKTSIMKYLINLDKGIKKRISLQQHKEDLLQLVVHLPDFIIELIKSKACRSSIMFGQELTFPEMRIMINGLLECRHPFICAHGRPTLAPILALDNGILFSRDII